MSDYIKREDALKPEIELLPDVSGLKTNQYESFLVEQVIQIYKNYLKNLPAADVVERKRRGKWKRKWAHRNGFDYAYEVCSECGAPVNVCGYDYCPTCGADMRGDSDV